MNPSDEIFFSLTLVAARYTCSARKIYRLMAENKFPKPVRFGGSLKWPLSDLMAYEKRLREKGDSK